MLHSTMLLLLGGAGGWLVVVGAGGMLVVTGAGGSLVLGGAGNWAGCAVCCPNSIASSGGCASWLDPGLRVLMTRLDQMVWSVGSSLKRT